MSKQRQDSTSDLTGISSQQGPRAKPGSSSYAVANQTFNTETKAGEPASAQAGHMEQAEDRTSLESPSANAQSNIQRQADEFVSHTPDLIDNSHTLAPDNAPVQQKINETGLPDHVKNGIEALSGMSMDTTRVHYNSAKPATLQAHAYTQGSNIYVAPGQEAHVGHEAWHVVQQAQDRVRPTMDMDGVPINDNAALEKEADIMGEKAAKV